MRVGLVFNTRASGKTWTKSSFPRCPIFFSPCVLGIRRHPSLWSVTSTAHFGPFAKPELWPVERASCGVDSSFGAPAIRFYEASYEILVFSFE